MTRRRVLVSLAVVLGVVVLVAVAVLLWVRSVLAFPGVPTFPTAAVVTPPADATCHVPTGTTDGVAIELLDLARDRVYLADGDNPITRQEFADTSVRFPLLKNSERFLLFDGACLFRSFDAPQDCRGEDCITYSEHLGHTWMTLNSVLGQVCVPDPDGCRRDVVDPGYLSVTVIDKCQDVTFSGPSVYVLSDGRGNEFVMHATADDSPDVDAPTLPDGWTQQERRIDEPLTIHARGEGHCYYPIVRDSAVQSYHQVEYADAQWSPESLTR